MSAGQEKAAEEPRWVPEKSEAVSLTFWMSSLMQPELKIPWHVPSSSRPATITERGTMMQPV